MQILIYKLNDAGDKYAFSDVCMQYETLEIKRDINYTGTASFVLVNDFESAKFALDDMLCFQKDPTEQNKREHYMVIDITRNKEIGTNVIKTTITAIPIINYILGNRIQTEDFSIGIGNPSYYVMWYIVNHVIGSQSKYSDEKFPQFTFAESGDKEKYSKNTSENIIIPKGKTALDNAKTYATIYNYYSDMIVYDLFVDAWKLTACLRVKYPTDKSESIIFSESMGNCVLTDYTLNNENEKNVCYTFAADGTITVNGAGVGIRRKETMAEKETYNNELDTTKLITNAKISFINNGMYQYITDFDLNTIVSFYDSNLGIKIAKPIESITEYYSNDKNELEISIGEFVPNVFDKLKGV